MVVLQKVAKFLEGDSLSQWEGEFLASITKQFNEKGRLSDKQWAVVERVVAKLEATPSDVAIDAANLYVLFFDARKTIKYPKFTLPFGDNHALRVKMTGARTKTPDVIAFEVDGNWAGYLNADGTLDVRRAVPEGTFELLAEFADDPQGVAADKGKESGNCVFCCRELSTARSLNVGYGPKCASNYGLEY